MVFRAVLRWCDAECERRYLAPEPAVRRALLHGVLPLVQFARISRECLAAEVIPCALLTGDDLQFYLHQRPSLDPRSLLQFGGFPPSPHASASPVMSTGTAVSTATTTTPVTMVERGLTPDFEWMMGHKRPRSELRSLDDSAPSTSSTHLLHTIRYMRTRGCLPVMALRGCGSDDG